MPATREQDINRIERPRFTIGTAPSVPPPADIPIFRGGEPSPELLRGLKSRIGAGEVPGYVLGLNQAEIGPLPPRPGPVVSPAPPSPKAPGDLFPILGRPVNIRIGIADRPGIGTFIGSIIARVYSGQRLPVKSILTCDGLTGKKRRDCLKRIARTAIENVLLQGLLRLPVRIPRSTVTFVGPVPKIPGVIRRPSATPVFVPPAPSVPQPPVRLPSEVTPGQLPLRPALPARTVVPPAPGTGDFPQLLPEIPAKPLPAEMPRPSPAPEILTDPLPLPSILPSPASKPLAKPKVTPAPKKSRLALPLGVVPALGLLTLTRGLTRRRSPVVSPRLVDLVGVTSAVGQVTPFASAFPSPATQLQMQRARQKECQEVKTKRKRRVCREGFYEELPGRTRYVPWREVNCITGKTIRTFR